jgi:predicted nucleotidyltransferase
MNSFDDYISAYLNESVIDIPRNSLDPTVFQFPDNGTPIMNPIIKTQIMNDIEKFRDIVSVGAYFVVGSILTKNYTPHSDIDVNVKINTVDGVMTEEIMDLIKHMNGSMAAGTTHPVNYFLIQDDYDLDKTDAAYDVANETWIKEPEDIDLDVQNYMNKFTKTINGMDFNTAELRRDIIDLEELKSLDGDQIKNLAGRVDAKIKEIEDGIESLIRSYMNIRTLRRDAFDKDMSPADIRKYGKKNKLPENVTYKLLERYYYFDFIKKLKEIVKDDNITDSEISSIKNAGKDFWK